MGRVADLLFLCLETEAPLGFHTTARQPSRGATGMRHMDHISSYWGEARKAA